MHTARAGILYARKQSKEPIVPSAVVSPAGELFLVVADSTNLVTDLRVEDPLLEGLVRAGSRPPVAGLFYRSLGGILHDRFTEWRTLLALNVSQIFAPIPVGRRRYDAV